MSIAVDGVNFGTHEHRFNGSFFHRSMYAGPPNLKMDEAWDRFTNTGSSKSRGLIISSYQGLI